jgi:hypothetical protein
MNSRGMARDRDCLSKQYLEGDDETFIKPVAASARQRVAR